MLAIFKREFRAYFHSMTGWLFLAANLFLSGLYFFALNLRYGYAGMANTVYNVVFLLLITVPILTMRMLSEERRQKTDQLILTAPVSVGKIVAGKYLSAVTVFTISTGMICVYPLILSAFGTVPFGESYTAILAYYLYGCACIAIGMFVSSLTESQVIAAVLSFGTLFLGYMMSSITIPHDLPLLHCRKYFSMLSYTTGMSPKWRWLALSPDFMSENFLNPGGDSHGKIYERETVRMNFTTVLDVVIKILNCMVGIINTYIAVKKNLDNQKDNHHGKR